VTYEVVGSAPAERKLEKLPKQDRDRIYSKFAQLEEDPRPHGYRKVVGQAHQGLRVRVGNYRIIYQVDDASRVIRIIDIEWRDKAYKKKK
jgi:mRNA interferase RelE/StbE